MRTTYGENIAISDAGIKLIRHIFQQITLHIAIFFQFYISLVGATFTTRVLPFGGRDSIELPLAEPDATNKTIPKLGQPSGNWARFLCFCVILGKTMLTMCTVCDRCQVVTLACYIVRHVSPVCAQMPLGTFLSQRGVAPDAPDLLRGSTPLHWACFG